MRDKSEFHGNVDVRNINSPGSTINLGQISGRVKNTINSIPELPGRDVAELKTALDSLIELIKNADGVAPEDAKDALENVEVVAEAAQNPEEPGVFEKAGTALRALKRMAGDFTAVTVAGKSVADLVAGVMAWWSKGGP